MKRPAKPVALVIIPAPKADMRLVNPRVGAFAEGIVFAPVVAANQEIPYAIAVPVHHERPGLGNPIEYDAPFGGDQRNRFLENRPAGFDLPLVQFSASLHGNAPDLARGGIRYSDQPGRRYLALGRLA